MQRSGSTVWAVKLMPKQLKNRSAIAKSIVGNVYHYCTRGCKISPCSSLLTCSGTKNSDSVGSWRNMTHESLSLIDLWLRYHLHPPCRVPPGVPLLLDPWCCYDTDRRNNVTGWDGKNSYNTNFLLAVLHKLYFLWGYDATVRSALGDSLT